MATASSWIGRHWRLLSVVAAGLAALAAGGAWWLADDKPLPPTVAVGRGDISETVLADGEIEAKRQVTVGAQVSGRITSLKVDLGDDVAEGQLVAEIDSMTQQNTLRNAQASLAAVIAQRDAKQASLAQARLAFTRQTRLLKQDAGSREDYETAEANLKVLQADIAVLDAQIEQAKISVDTAKVNLGYTRITAPISGTVVALPVDEGQTVNANQTAPTLMKIAQLGVMTVRAEVSEADIPRVKPGQAVTFTILGDLDTPYRATVRTIEPATETFNSSTTTSSTSSSSSSSTSSSSAIYYNALFDVDNPDRRLRIEMTAQVSIIISEAKDAVVIPASILGLPGKDGLYGVEVMKDDGSIERRRVAIGINNNIQAQVTQGLEPGERVVSTRAVAAAAAAANSGPSRSRRPPMGGLMR